jgi:hypothetical protein
MCFIESMRCMYAGLTITMAESKRVVYGKNKDANSSVVLSDFDENRR